MAILTLDKPVEDFIARWSASEGAERANFQLFAAELCDLIGVTRPIAFNTRLMGGPHCD